MVPVPDLQMRPADWALLVLHSVLWGSAYVFVAIAGRELPLATIVSFRLIPAAAVLLLIAWFQGHRLPARLSDWTAFFVLALLNILLPSILTVWGQRNASSGLAAILVTTSPLFSALLAHVLTNDDRLSANKLAGIVAGIAGVAIVLGADVLASGDGSLLAKLALTGAAALYALAAIYARRFHGTPPIIVSASHVIIGLAVSLPVALAIDQPWQLPMPSMAAIASVVGMGVISLALASLCYFTLIKRAGPTNALLVTMLVPLTPIVIGALFLGERLLAREFAGAGVILCALIIIDGRLLSWVRRRLLRRGLP